MNKNTWSLVLAAGEGTRLRSLTTTSSGVAIPKQFCSLNGGSSLMQDALRRASSVAERSRVCTVVAADHRRWWESAVWSLPARNVIVQPRNRGTANGILLPLLHIAARDPEARVVLLPSDHFVRDEHTLSQSLREAVAQLDDFHSHIVLLGMEPEEADPELGYIVPGRGTTATLHVRQFVEKPSLTLTRSLLADGALWNSFILAGRVAAFLDLYVQRYSELLNEMRTAVARDLDDPGDAMAAAELYERLPDLDFSRHVMEGAEGRLRLLPVPACGWSDLGTPKRVADALRRHAIDTQGERDASHFSVLNLALQHARLGLAS